MWKQQLAMPLGSLMHPENKMEYKILVVDDDQSITNLLQTELAQVGYAVSVAHDGNAAVLKNQAEHQDLIIMDVMMPDCNGLMATMKIREMSNVPVLMLSAKAEGSDRILGLEVGADDYLVKPFMKQELLARVKALLRRYDHFGSIRENGKHEILICRDVELNTATKEFVVRGEPVHLTATEYKIVEYLMQNAGIVVSAEQIYQAVWKSDAYSVENTVMIHISRIREKMEINPKKPEYIQVVWGIGYVFKK